MTCATELVRYLHLIHNLGFVGSQFLNLVLVWLIVARSGSCIGSYKYAMLVFTLCSMLYSWVEILVQPVAHIKGPMFFVFMDSRILSIPKSIGQFLTCLHCDLTGLVACLLACQFLYRYIALCRNHLLIRLKGTRLALIFTPAVFVFLSWHIAFYFGMPNTLEKQMNVKEELATCFGVNSEATPIVGPMYWARQADGTVVWKPLECFSSLMCVTTLFACFVTIIVCGLKIVKNMLKAKAHFSAKTMEMNRQLFRMLCIQTVIPMFTMYTPLGLFAMLPMFGMDIPYLGNLTSSSLAVYPILEPLIAMTCVANFRKSIKS